MGNVSLGDIYAARRRIEGRVVRTPTVRSASLSAATGANVQLKLEILQAIGAFKIRGATNRIVAMDDAQRSRGVVTVSTGNHGRAVASAARDAGARAVVCMSDLVPTFKREAIAALGAEVRIIGKSQDDAEIEADRLAEEEGLISVHPFDDAHVIAGQGTIGLELLEDLGQVDTFVCPLSGGGLMGGVALALKSANPAVRIVGVCMDKGAAMVESVRAGQPVPVVEYESLADSLGGGIGMRNQYTLRLISDLVDDYILLSEADIASSMHHALMHEGFIAEGGGSVAMGAIALGRIPDLEGNVAVIVSGRNIAPDKFLDVIGKAVPAL
jgi:threonine dehydratase